MTSEGVDASVVMELPSEWVNDNSLPLVLAMQTHVGSLAQYEGLHLLTFGQYDVPIPVGETDEQRAQYMRDAVPVPLRVVGRFAVPDDYFREFVASLVEYLERIDERDAGVPE